MLPLISIITPTIPTRKHLLDRLERIINRQTYDNIEWLIDDRKEPTIGAKRNNLCASCNGEYILMLDDDDLISDDFIEKCYEHMIATGANTTGFNNAYFYSPTENKAWEYKYRGTQPYVFGSSMMFSRNVWLHNKFPDKNIGEDSDFVANSGKIVPRPFKNDFLVLIHGKNTASHRALSIMKEVNPDKAKEFYLNSTG